MNLQQREARPQSWLETRGLSWAQGSGFSTACRRVQSGRAGTQDRRGCGLAGREGPSGGGFSVTVASALSG